MRWQRNPRTTTRVEIGSRPEKEFRVMRVNNDPKSQRKNGGTDQEDTRNI